MFRYVFLFFISTSYANTNFMGTYDLDVKIGEQKFVDILEIKLQTHGLLEGTFEVSGVFKSDFHGVYFLNEMEGEFVAREGGQEFEVELKAFKTGPCTLQGLLSSNRQQFATFNGLKRGCYE